MTLSVDGEKWSFSYQEPRPGMQKELVQTGSMAFEGTRSGNVISGTAFVYSRVCGRRGYFVQGTVSDDEKVVALAGFAPYVNPENGCADSGGHNVVNLYEFKEVIVHSVSPVDITEPVESAREEGRQAGHQQGWTEGLQAGQQQAQETSKQAQQDASERIASLEGAVSQAHERASRASEAARIAQDSERAAERSAQQADEEKQRAFDRIGELEEALKKGFLYDYTPIIVIPTCSFLIEILIFKGGKRRIRFTLAEFGFEVLIAAGFQYAIYHFEVVPKPHIWMSNPGLLAGFTIAVLNAGMKWLFKYNYKISE